MDFTKLFKEARNSLKGKNILVMFIVFVYLIVSEGATIAENILNIIGVINGSQNLEDNSQPLWIILIELILQALLIVGYTTIMLNLAKGKDIKLGDLVSNWRLGFKAICLVLLETLYVILWSLLFIIPGIVKAYSYSMSLYILVEDPSKGINECITESKELMDGYKAALFGIQIMFSVVIVAVIAVIYCPIALIAFYITASVSSSNIISITIVVIMALIFIVFVLWWSAVEEVATAHFYLKITKQEATYKRSLNERVADNVNSSEANVIE